jgi:hypothetical protein
MDSGSSPECPGQARNDKNTTMRGFTNYDTASLRVVVDFRGDRQKLNSWFNIRLNLNISSDEY